MAMDTGDGVGRAAMKSGMHRNTARRHLSRGLLPSDRAEPRAYRTRADPFVEHWEEVVALLREQPGLEAKTLFGVLREKYVGQYEDGQLRTLQRRVRS